jgi:hypothetical protein
MLRLAPEGLVSVSQLRALGLEMKSKSLTSLPGDPAALHLLAEIGNFDISDLNRRSWTITPNGISIYGHEMPRGWLTPNRRRVAPGMLVDDGAIPFARGLWQVNAFMGDLDTGEYLIDRCPRCRQFLRWDNAEDVTNCGSCRFDLRQQPPTFVPNDRLEADLKLFNYLLSRGLPHPFSAMSGICIFKAMEWFAYFMDLRKGTFLKPSPENAAHGVASLYDWPASFDATIAEYLLDSADPPTAASKKARRKLMDELITAIGRVQSSAVHDVLIERAIHILGNPAIDSLVQTSVFGRRSELFSNRRFQLSVGRVKASDLIEAMRSSHR